MGEYSANEDAVSEWDDAGLCTVREWAEILHGVGPRGLATHPCGTMHFEHNGKRYCISAIIHYAEDILEAEV